MPRILIFLAVLLFVAGGGTAAWWFGLQGGSMPFAKEAQAATPSQTSEFVELKPLTFPIVRDGQVNRLMTLVISVEVKGEEARIELHRKAPALRDAMLSELHGLYAHRFMEERNDGLTLVKLRLLKAGRRVMEDLQGVYVQAVQGQRQPGQG